MSGLLALLDDVAAIAKVAASSIDDIAAAAAKAGTKAAGVVIDDAAVTESATSANTIACTLSCFQITSASSGARYGNTMRDVANKPTATA